MEESLLFSQGLRSYSRSLGCCAPPQRCSGAPETSLAHSGSGGQARGKTPSRQMSRTLAQAGWGAASMNVTERKGPLLLFLP